jgi:hypothetical protein
LLYGALAAAQPILNPHVFVPRLGTTDVVPSETPLSKA